jgi:hypothetical protein
MKLYVKALFLATLAAVVSSCAYTLDGIPMYRFSRRKSQPAAVVSRITQLVEQHFGYRGEFWDGPYKRNEIIRLIRMTKESQRSFSGFAEHTVSDDLFICYSFVIMDGFTLHGAEKKSGYLPEAVFYLDSDGGTGWYELQQKQPDMLPEPTPASVTPAANAPIAPPAGAAHR